MADFDRVFRDSIRQLQEQVDSLSSPKFDLAQRKATTEALLASSVKLAAQLGDASNELAAYDLRSYNQALKDIQDKLATNQASYAPKPKFSFKNKRLATPQSEASSAATSRSITPSQPDDSGLDRPVPVFAQPIQQVDSAACRRAEGQSTAPATGVALTETHISIHGSSKAYLNTAGLTNNDLTTPSCVVSNVSKSIVYLDSDQSHPPPLLTINDVEESLILAARINGPAHITNLESSILVMSCRQFRMHNSHAVDVYLYCSSRPIIENCSSIRFTTIPATFNQKAESTTNRFDQVDDFKWLRSEQSPNWSLLKQDQAIQESTWQKISQDLAKVESGSTQEGSQVEQILDLAGIGKVKQM